MLPDEPGTKVNRCVENVLKLWREGEADKLTQLIFSDISTPQADKAKFIIYEDIRQKLVAGGVPREEVVFIHEAETDTQKKELFAKVNAGQVRVLIGSTQKMGAGTNIQQRLIALHDLDAPWRPRDLIQRKGRIERRGNMNQKHRSPAGKIPAHAWEQEQARLQQEYKTEYEQYKPIKDDLWKLQHVKRNADTALHHQNQTQQKRQEAER